MRDRGSLSPVRKLGQHGAKWLTGYGYHCFYAFLWLAGLFTVTALLALFWLGPEKYIVAGARRRDGRRPRPPAGVRQPGPLRHAARPAAASATPRRRSPSASAPAGLPVPALPCGAAAPPGPGRREAGRRRAGECSVPARIGYAIELAFPIINLNSSPAGQCDVPATGGAPGVWCSAGRSAPRPRPCSRSTRWG